ncbi:glycosyltransferase [Levilactobacillus acidifarinae]|uniref:Cps1G protein n=1 Tax=Levilactobacillus acidifarinae DSM 19394 = JCM 15949 TaxID=1423715 RepID=A0A0R1LS71_9LACO|nr:glycosyltransferase [Levilactobacillus acidifarinae]KRK95130.1 cps1G protein [Levilactobacillus acidifarinae DSM 19394]GEO70629.1 glycosyltransferase family 1 (GT1) [Levilactobacillus acidifarinae]
MRVLVIGDFLKASGMTRYIFNVIGHIKAPNLKIDVLSISGSKECQDMVLQHGWGFNVIPPANGDLKRHLKQSRQFFKKNASKYDVIHFNETALWNFLPILFAHHFGAKRIILNSHNTYFASSGNKIVLKCLEILHQLGKKLVDRIVSSRVAVSKEAANWMFTKKSIREHKVKIIPNGIKLEKFVFDLNIRNRVREQLNIPDNWHLYGNVGILNDRKNQVRLLSIFKQLLSIEKDAKLILIGNGPAKNKILQTMEKLDLNDYVILLNATDRISDYYQAMDAIIMPSLNEGLSTVLLEAQTNGLTFFPSATIPLGNELKNLVHPIELSKSDEFWAKIIEQSMSNCSQRRSYLKEMKKRGYGVEDAAEGIYRIYLGEG